MSITDIFACCVGALDSSTLFLPINIWLLRMRLLCQFLSSTNCLPLWLIVAKLALLCLLSSYPLKCAPNHSGKRLNPLPPKQAMPVFKMGFPYPRASTCGSWGQSACWSRDHREDIVAARLHCWEVMMMVVKMLVVVVIINASTWSGSEGQVVVFCLKERSGKRK